MPRPLITLTILGEACKLWSVKYYSAGSSDTEVFYVGFNNRSWKRNE